MQIRIFFILFFVLMGTSPAISERIVEDFSLTDHQGRFHQLYTYSDKKAIVIVSYGIGCPIARQSLAALHALKNQFEPQGVIFFLLDANSQDDNAAIVKEVRDYGIDIPVLEDPSGLIAELFNIKRTAEAIVIAPNNWQVLYHGAIHDGINYENNNIKMVNFYLKNVLTSVLEKKPVTIKKNFSKGCLINFQHSQNLTYTKDIAPILKQKCLMCHSSGGMAPWSMSDYEKVKGWGPMIREVVRTQRMPPWDADPHYGKFKNDISLSPIETAKLVHWVEQGMTRGKGKDPLIQNEPVSHEWALGKPDIVFTLPEKQDIPATGTDVFVVITANQTVEQDLWLKALEIKPGNVRLVHHCNIVVQSDEPDQAFADEQFPSPHMETGQVIAGYSPGIRGIELPDDTGIFIPQGSKIIFRIHYVTTGKPEVDLTKVGFYLYKEKPAKILSVSTIVNRDFVLLPGAKDYHVKGEYTFAADVLLTGLQPHMHYRGKSMRFTAFYPDGKSEILLSTPHYRFNWQRIYTFAEPKMLPASTKIVLEGMYDNSAQNPLNPDSSQTVKYGPQSGAEMFTGIMFYIKEKD